MHFFDYSLWNHYVNVHLPLFKALMHGLWVIFYTINVFLIDYIFSLLIICFSFYTAPESYSGFSLYLFLFIFGHFGLITFFFFPCIAPSLYQIRYDRWLYHFFYPCVFYPCIFMLLFVFCFFTTTSVIKKQILNLCDQEFVE